METKELAMDRSSPAARTKKTENRSPFVAQRSRWSRLEGLRGELRACPSHQSAGTTAHYIMTRTQPEQRAHEALGCMRTTAARHPECLVGDARADDCRTHDGCHKPWVSSGEEVAGSRYGDPQADVPPPAQREPITCSFSRELLRVTVSKRL
jgi:hypothetical protein